MADKFHAVFSPGTAINIGDTLIIAFDSPPEADPVTVTLEEVDAWVSDGASVTESTGSPVLVAEFTGKITGKKFQGTLTKKGTSTATSPPTLKLLFDGQSATAVQTIPIPDATLSNEDGIFEIQLTVTGTIKKKTASFKTPSPVFVRNFKTGKPVVAFITGSGSGYFTAADAFMHSYADGTFSLGTVLEIREFLRTQAAARGFGPWGEANIVSHGNATEWVITPFPGAPSPHLRWWDIKDLQAKSQFTPAIDKQLTTDSKLVIRGCAIGNDTRLLNEIRRLFGGQTTVFAPKFLQFYQVTGTVARESFFEFFFFFAKAQTAPNDAACVTELKTKYPTSGISDSDWLKMLQNTTEDPNGFRASHAGSVDRHETIPWRITTTVNHPEKPRKGLHGPTPPEVTAAIAGNDWAGKAKAGFNSATPKENLETNFDDWFWVEGPLEEKPLSTIQTSFSKLFTGHRVRIEIRRELRKAGVAVKPDLTNNDHYGHSP
jgi:hypothetical protein